MHYHEIYGRFYEVDEDYIFQDKINLSLAKVIDKRYVNGYDCIPEPEPEEVTEND